jgi:undecaprenyl-phosphate 4-deoxy-4-formamido-L-arabinose transferase
MMMLGMLGEYVGRIYISINNSPQYVIREVVKRDEELEYS